MSERRKRISRPLPILVFGIVFLILPFINYINFAYQLELSPKDFFTIITSVDLFGLILACFPMIVGIGILMVKKWGWWSFLVYSILVIVYNLLVLISEPTQVSTNLITLIQSTIGFAAMFYFLKPDISAPYMNVDSRGWRFQKRKPIEITLRINSLPYRTKDLSSTGAYIEWKNSEVQLNQDVTVEFEFGSFKFEGKAGVVRIDETGVGLAFRNLERGTLNELSKFVNKQEELA